MKRQLGLRLNYKLSEISRITKMEMRTNYTALAVGRLQSLRENRVASAMSTSKSSRRWTQLQIMLPHGRVNYRGMLLH